MHTPFMDKHKQQSPHRRDNTAGGRLKQRLARILTRSTCTTNACSSGGGGTTTAAFVSLTKNHHPEPAEAPPSPYFCTPCTYDNNKVPDGSTHPRHHHHRRHSHSRSASLVHISVDCTRSGAGATSGRRSVHSDAPLLHHLSVPARDVVKKPSKGRSRSRSRSGKPAAAARSPSVSRRWHGSSSSSSWGRARRPRPTSSGGTPTPAYSYSWSSSSSSSGSTGDELAPFSGSDGEDGGGGDELAETRTLFSSLSFSSDSTSEFYHHHATTNNGGGSTSRRRNNRVNSKQMMRRSRRAPPRRALSRTTCSHDPAPAPDAYFRPVVSVETTKTKQRRECDERKNKEEMGRGLNDAAKKKVPAMGGSAGAGVAAAEEETTGGGAGTAVVKRSSNPYLDFRSSMVEMVVERRIGSVGKMEELLGSYLSLNSPRHHPAILAAFEDVWEAVFGEE